MPSVRFALTFPHQWIGRAALWSVFMGQSSSRCLKINTLQMSSATQLTGVNQQMDRSAVYSLLHKPKKEPEWTPRSLHSTLRKHLRSSISAMLEMLILAIIFHSFAKLVTISHSLMMMVICSQIMSLFVEATGAERTAMTIATLSSQAVMILMLLMTTTVMESLELTPIPMFLMRINGVMALVKWE